VLLLYPLLLFTMHPTDTVRQPDNSHQETRHAMMARRQGHSRHERPDGGVLQGGYGRRADRKTGELAGDSHVDGHERQHRHDDGEGHERRYEYKHDDEGKEHHGKPNNGAKSSGLQPGQTATLCRVRPSVRCDVR
jgi:hypothetical protein